MEQAHATTLGARSDRIAAHTPCRCTRLRSDADAWPQPTHTAPISIRCACRATSTHACDTSWSRCLGRLSAVDAAGMCVEDVSRRPGEAAQGDTGSFGQFDREARRAPDADDDG